MRQLHSAVAVVFPLLAVLSALMGALAIGHAGLEAHVLARPDRLRIVAELGADEEVRDSFRAYALDQGRARSKVTWARAFSDSRGLDLDVENARLFEERSARYVLR